MQADMEQEYSISPSMTVEEANQRVRIFMNKVYLWMAVTLLISAGTAAYAVTSPKLLFWVAENYVISTIGCLVLLLVMSFAGRALSSSTLGALLIVFCAMEGLLLGPLMSIVAPDTIVTAFACTAGMFGVMSIYGACTRTNLSGMRRFLFMCLIGLLIAIIVNVFVGSGMMGLIISVIGVILFAAFTAYDTQMLRTMALELDGEGRDKGAIFGALALYLDFLNMFLFLLSLLRQE